MTAPPLLCAALEIALNRYLALEPDALAECGRLQGRVLALHAEGPGWEFFLCPHAAGVQVLDAWPDPPAVRITAPPAALARRVLRGPDAAGAGVRVEGDAELLARFSAMLAKVGFDLEEWLARAVGDGPAHRLTQGLRGLVDWGRRSASTLALDTAEYLREETRDLVHRADAERWMDDVTTLSERTARLTRRLEELERRA
jgi:ubiquinone biosynthesis protein UbiJ